MSETPPPPPSGGDPDQPPPPTTPPSTTPYPQQPTPQGWQPGWQESWQPATGGPPAGQPPYGQPPNPQVPYGAPMPGYGPIAPDHPQATTVLILGILGLVLCQVISPFAWVMGNRVIREIDASGGTIGGRSNANAGRICGIVGTALIGLGLLVAVGVVIVAIIGTATA
ncbi:hypothetical protein [Nocardioides dilutus]